MEEEGKESDKIHTQKSNLVILGLNYSYLWGQSWTDSSCKNTYPATDSEKNDSFGQMNFSGTRSLSGATSTQLSDYQRADTLKP